jgi:biotin transporter BioY
VLRHEFQPGRLIAGAVLTAAGVMYLGDARGAWEAPWFAIIPVISGGLCLAAVAGLLARAARRGRAPRREPHAGQDGATAP